MERTHRIVKVEVELAIPVDGLEESGRDVVRLLESGGLNVLAHRVMDCWDTEPAPGAIERHAKVTYQQFTVR